MMEIEVKTDLAKQDVFTYYLYTNFTHAFGVARIVVSLLFLIVGIYSFGRIDILSSILLLCLGLFNPLGAPLVFYAKSSAVEKQKKRYHYRFGESSLLVRQDDQEKEIPWDRFVRIDIFRPIIIMKINRLNAFIIPRRILEEEDEKAIINLLASIRKKQSRDMLLKRR